MIADAIPFARDAAIEILDVGAGYGALTQFLLEQFPAATALCQDGSDEMAKLGRRRMAKWKGRFDYVIADFSKPGWSRAIHGNFDAVVSTIAIHNVRAPGIIEAIMNAKTLTALPKAEIRFIEPMYARLVNELPEGKEWLYEVKFDGYRCLAGRDSKGVPSGPGEETSLPLSSHTSSVPANGSRPARS